MIKKALRKAKSPVPLATILPLGKNYQAPIFQFKAQQAFITHAPKKIVFLGENAIHLSLPGS